MRLLDFFIKVENAFIDMNPAMQYLLIIVLLIGSAIIALAVGNLIFQGGR